MSSQKLTYKLLSHVEIDDPYSYSDTFYVEVDERDILTVEDGYITFTKYKNYSRARRGTRVFDTLIRRCAKFALRYAIERGPSQLTRNCASQCPNTAYDYARLVDNKPTEATFNGVKDDPGWKEDYIDLFSEIDSSLWEDSDGICNK